ncbi:hypothetical protein NQ113_24700 [Bacillus pseudomycoides]|uniref:hypothetical protein n=1 Tax=Bacillus pseudomycoides TaxID=64104 RepID=UPI00215A2283|nr:hypothetical protein [Bacillus pseudomycoides]MCR8860374.1 hypothetical protein [Bacillus pseudomycoides]
MRNGDKVLVNNKWAGLIHQALSDTHIIVKRDDDKHCVKVNAKNVKLLEKKKLTKEDVKMDRYLNNLDKQLRELKSRLGE